MADLKRRIIAEFSAKNKAKGVMGGFRRDLDVTGRALRRMAVGALAVAGIGGLGYMLKKQMEVIDSTAKLSDRLNITTESLIAMQHGAGIAGVQQETFNKSLEIFVRRLGEVDMGVGQAKYALDKLGLNYKELIGLSVDVAFGRIADQIRGLATQAEKAAAANYLFGRSGQVLLNFFEKGSEGLKEYKEFVEKTGLAFSRFDAAQVEAANDALMNVRAALTGIFRQVTIELAPYIEAAATSFVDLAIAGEGVGAKVVNAFEAIALSIVSVAEEVERLLKKLTALTSPVDYMRKMTEATEAAWKRYRQETGEAMAGKYTLGPLYAPVQPKDKALFDRILAEERAGVGVEVISQESRVRAAFENIRKKATTGPEQVADLAWAMKKMGKIYEEEKNRQASLVTEQEDMMLEHYEKLNAMGGNYQEMQERMARQRIETEITVVTQQMEAEKVAAQEIEDVWTEMWLKEEEAAYHAMRAPIIEAENAARESAERRKRINEDIAASMAQSWASAIDQMMFEGKKFWDAMEDMGRSLTRMIANILIYRGIAEPIATGIMGTKSAQHGGVFTRPTLVQAGEVPEAFVPLRSGKIPVEMRGGPASERGTLEMNVYYHGQEKPKITRAEEYMLSDRRIVNVTLQAFKTDANYRRAVQQIRR